VFRIVGTHAPESDRPKHRVLAALARGARVTRLEFDEGPLRITGSEECSRAERTRRMALDPMKVRETRV